ncbi:NADPH-dependent FMN reductase [Chitinilyticum piscinae]|uniref:NAD(P)H-dependent oxidoreductase n=1 Tax=Chitinilyticum piscinae TaxID=2866724 RepID=A0A8J7K146_9NEIS|nr:NADPH-dependent FMN reductase [Chitinilyticum piscinae]MBE9608122.1 NAD(P)H-dependent oxidoreductase [Chitinilyticum piscinae]
MSKPLKFVGLCGSLRKASRNAGLLRYAGSHVPDGVSFEVAEVGDLPFYNGDIAEKPAAVQRLVEQLRSADALVIACPEYNYSMAPALKNALDWASREAESPLAGKPLAIMGAGGGMGTSRAQYHLRQTCVFLDLRPLNKPEVFANAFTASFNEAGDLVDEKLQELIRQQLQVLAAAV